MEDVISTIRVSAAAIALLSLAATHTAAEEWPARPLTMIVPGGSGGPLDVVGRIIAPRMSELLGRPVIVEPMPGAGGMTAAARVARGQSDGYQFLIGAGGVLAQNQTLYKRPIYDSATDFAPVGLIATAPPILVTRNDFPAANLQEFISYGRAHAGALQFGSPGLGSGPHVTCLLLNASAGISAIHIPYRGSAQVYQDLMAGRVDYMCDFVSAAVPQIKANAVKAIATLTRERAAPLPDLATAQEQGLPGFDAPGWYALVLPAGTPDALVRRLNKAMSDALDSPGVGDRLAELGNRVASAQQRTPEYLATFIRSEIAKWAAPIRTSGVSLE
jgi:tripartite-type tricarboxylate transporter receptor subunit TctC